MTISNRISKLEQAIGPRLVIYLTDPFLGDDEETKIRKALVDDRQFERQSDEVQDAFMARVNPKGQRSVYLDTDTHDL